MAVEVSELRLVWPPELFAAEARALLGEAPDDDEALGSLMVKAFYGDRGYKLLLERPGTWSSVPFGAEVAAFSQQTRPRAALVDGLAARAENLPRYEAPRYYRARRASPGEPRRLDLPEVKTAYAATVAELESLGYFDDAFGSTCIESDDDPRSEGQRQLSEVLELDLVMWPLRRGERPTQVELGWSEEDLYDIVEALHDLIARPRRRYWHSFGEEWDYGDFSRPGGQAVYRWKVNEILERSQLPVRLAQSGEDAGRLVHVTGDDRDQLLEQVLGTPNPADRAEVEHAAALLRARGATRHDKRSAVVALHRVLEDRRALLKRELLSGDEGALFEIANRYDLRHRKADQRTDYDDAYLDWVFWWYLATIDLTDRLLARQAGSS